MERTRTSSSFLTLFFSVSIASILTGDSGNRLSRRDIATDEGLEFPDVPVPAGFSPSSLLIAFASVQQFSNGGVKAKCITNV